MKVYVSGSTGWVGGSVVRALKSRNCEVVPNLTDDPEAVIHLAWAGLPHYENSAHFRNIGWQIEFLRRAITRGITNITIAGTCLETLPILIPYSIAKLAIRALAFELLHSTKWTRLWYLYGKGQNEASLLPQLAKAKGEFSIIDGERDFMHVTEAANHIVDIALQTKVTGIIDVCTGIPTSVEAFCKSHAPKLTLVKDYPRPYYEPISFCGDPTKLNSI